MSTKKELTAKNGTSLTDDEAKAVRSLQRLASQWPDGLWLYSASGNLWVMKCDENNEQVMLPIKGCAGGGTDPGYCVTKIDIPNDGGDW